jgi:hypothetical protein
MKNTPSKRESLLTAAWYRCSSSMLMLLTPSTMPARPDCYWRESDIQLSQHMGASPAAEAGAVGGIIGNIMRGQ